MKSRRALALALVAAFASVATAAPKKRAARVHFDRGVAAYTKGDFAAARDALAKSYALERDEETMFALAQAHRKLDRCDKAIELYEELLDMDLPVENKDVIRVQIEECRAILSVEAGLAPGEPEPAAPEPDDAGEPAVATPVPTSYARSRWSDPLGGMLVGAGAVGLAVGTVFLIQGSAADADKDAATTYAEYERLSVRAEARGRVGVIAMAAGGALLVGGVIRYATLSTPSERTVSGWLAPGGGGIVLGGRF